MHLGVRAQESSLSDVFAPGERLRMPPYQRSYSWGEPEALELLGDPVAWGSAQQAGIARVERYYSDTQMFDRYREVYTQALAREGRTAGGCPFGHGAR